MAEPEAPMPRLQGADYHFHVLFEPSNLRVNYQGAALRWDEAQRRAADELALIASDQRFKV